LIGIPLTDNLEEDSSYAQREKKLEVTKIKSVLIFVPHPNSLETQILVPTPSLLGIHAVRHRQVFLCGSGWPTHRAGEAMVKTRMNTLPSNSEGLYPPCPWVFFPKTLPTNLSPSTLQRALKSP
jgi:hypothetical protein